METLVSAAIGIGLSAAAGFRVFVPLGAVGTAVRAVTVPILAVILVVAACVAVFRAARRFIFGRRPRPSPS